MQSKTDPQDTGIAVDALTGTVSYDVKQGRTNLQLQVGTMALQVFKGGKPVDNILFKDMKNWRVRCLPHHSKHPHLFVLPCNTIVAYQHCSSVVTLLLRLTINLPWLAPICTGLIG